MKKIAVLFGGTSTEHDISVQSATSILKEINQKEFEVTPIGITKENRWIVLSKPEIEKNWEEKQELQDILSFLKQFDLIFPILHGKGGEDGTLQGFLELFKIPYVGCPSSSSALGMDKDLSKKIFQCAKIPQLPYLTIQKNYSIKKIEKEIAYPIIVKPACGGSSIGINTAKNRKELKQAIDSALKLDHKVLLEPFIQARELECAVLEDKIIKISEVGEIKPVNSFYDFEAKYQSEQEQTIIPADIPKKIKKQIQEYTKKAFTAIGGKGLSRVDFFYQEETDSLYLNEINTAPGFTSISMYPKLWKHQGISYQKLINILLNQALSSKE